MGKPVYGDAGNDFLLDSIKHLVNAVAPGRNVKVASVRSDVDFIGPQSEKAVLRDDLIFYRIHHCQAT